jgi:membrane-associated phospholipid phosphatase
VSVRGGPRRRGPGLGHLEVVIGSLLNAVSLGSLVVATVVIGFIAVARRRYRLALVATMLIGGANLTSQILKQYVIDRPDLGIAGTDIGARNSMPSGHMTVAASVAVAVLAVGLTDQGELTPPVQLSTNLLVGAYVSGVAGVAGATCLVMAVVLSNVHRVVPKLDQPTLIEAISRRVVR